MFFETNYFVVILTIKSVFLTAGISKTWQSKYSMKVIVKMRKILKQ